jgi:hypothetical protein
MIFVLQGCMLTGKMDKIVSEYYAKKRVLKPIENNNSSVIPIDSLKRINGFCKSEYKNFFTVPLIFYYYSKEKILCRINPKIYANAILSEFNDQLIKAVDDKKLNGKTIEIIFNNIPTSFIHSYKDHLLIVQYANMSFVKDEVYNEGSDLRISYIIRNKQTLQVIKKGRVIEPFPGSFYRKTYGERRKVFIKNFVTTFDEHLQVSCKQIAQLLIKELD